MSETIQVGSEAGNLRIRRNQSLSLFTTFRIGGPADFLARVSTAEEVEAALEWAAREKLPVTAIGGGSNLLVSDRGIRGLVLLVRATGKDAEKSIRFEQIDDGIRLWVPAQMPISRLGHLTASRGWEGLVWCAGLPGMVGGAVVNNAGAHGGEMIDHLESIEILDLEQGTQTWSAARLEARYRYTVLKFEPRPRRHIVLGATFGLPLGDAAELDAQATEFAKWRRRAQPTGACAGSVFTNPAGDYAGRLIDEAGLKGRRIGGVQVSELHGNFLVNTGDATAQDVRDIIQMIQEEVERQFQIRLIPEIEKIGEA
jgi:UDP-N-acetylmuramate dehydrogenase